MGKKEIGYCQGTNLNKLYSIYIFILFIMYLTGMNFVAALLLKWLDEENTFLILAKLIDNYEMDGLYGHIYHNISQILQYNSV